MYHYLFLAKLIGQKKILRQIRNMALCTSIIISYWLLKPGFQKLYFCFSVIGIVIIFLDMKRKKQELCNSINSGLTRVVLIGVNLFCLGTLFITRPDSYLGFTLLFTLFLFCLDYNMTIILSCIITFQLFNLINLLFTPKTTILIINQFCLLFAACFGLFGLYYFSNIQHHYQRKIDRLLSKDELTGLYNRRFMKKQLFEAAHKRVPFALIMLDINYFKYFNDCWGHTEGDNLLIFISKVIKKSVREQDIVVRYSGDEFIILVSEASKEIVERIISQINSLIESNHFPGEKCFPNKKLSISFGYAIYPIQIPDIDKLFEAADQALYRFKNERYPKIS